MQPESWPTTSSLLQQSLLLGTTDVVPPTIVADGNEHDNKSNDKKEPVDMITHKVRVYPTRAQSTLLNKWIGTSRWTYNQVVATIRKKTTKASKKDLRALLLNKTSLMGTEYEWVLETPYDIRDEAMADVLKAIKTNFAAKRKRFHLKFRSRKDEHQSITVLKKHWNHKRGDYSSVFGATKLRSPESLPTNLECDSRLIKTALGHWYLCLPLQLKKIEHGENQANGEIDSGEQTSSILALDPGVRTFMTGYDPSGKVWEWGKQDIGRIYRLCHTIDKMQSEWSQKDVRHGRKYRLKKAAMRVRLKIRNLIDEMHKKLAKWLCENYRTVLLPAFETSGMIRRGQRKINSKTVRGMVTWSHYRFRQRLLHKVRAYPGRTIIVCDEAYTSKTCGQCGVLHRQLGGCKVFKCPSCKVVIDRDVNGARNILLRYLTLHGSVIN
jgi:putative transposase